jgi:ATP-dependent helicase HrpB
MTALPIDSKLPAIVSALARAGSVVVQAEPGAGKTTRVPPAVADALAPDQKVLVLEPRRLAARTAAARVASQLGQKVGERVGTMMRFERKVSKSTRILYLTEAVLSRWIARERNLEGIGAVIFDEVHERHLHGDLSLAMVDQLRRSSRKDLWAVAMSATLDTQALAEFMDAPTVICSGRQYPVSIEHQRILDRDELAIRIAKAVRRLCREGLDGHVLVFLDGSRSIERTRRCCEAVARDEDLKLCSLYGRLSREQQDEALAPSRQRKVVLSTNIAESSVTIDGVVAVVDSGLAKTISYDRGLQRPRLRLAPISQASAIQRAGRAGRTAPGRCIRLYSEQDFARRPRFDAPEIERIDLSSALLLLGCGGALRADRQAELRWLTCPPPEALEAARRLLCNLGALDRQGEVTPLGREMVRLPLHPRLARVAIESCRRGVADETLRGVAELTEGQQASGGSVAKLLRQIRRQLPRPYAQQAVPPATERERQIAGSWLSGFSDRVVRKAGAEDQLAVADGGRASMPRGRQNQQALGRGGFGILLAAQESAAGLKAERLFPLDAEHLLEEMDDAVELETKLWYNADRARVEASDEIRYRGLIVERCKAKATPGPAAATHLLPPTRQLFQSDPGLQRWLSRLRFAAGMMPDIQAPDEEGIDRILLDACQESIQLPCADALLHRLHLGRSGLDFDLRGQVESLAPLRLRLSQERQLTIQYPRHEPPYVESYLQDFFGCAASPTIACGRLPLVLKLWAPNGRPVQVTSDLAGFWQRHYPELRRQLARRYPKHHWPDEPHAARPVRLRRHLV